MSPLYTGHTLNRGNAVDAWIVGARMKDTCMIIDNNLTQHRFSFPLPILLRFACQESWFVKCNV